MFTGIIEATATVQSRASARLTLTRPMLFTDVVIGSSIAVDGVCLTVVTLDDATIGFDVVETTWNVTSLGALTPGSRVNLERAMPAHGRFDGHIVQGHVEGTAAVIGLHDHATEKILTIKLPTELLPAIVDRGSITVNGVSLTVKSCRDDIVEIALVPHTCAVTTLGALTTGMRVNIETDILARYVSSLLAHGA